MLVLNAHNVADTSGEGFAVRLFRKGNQRGFIRALSDQPSFFAAGFNKVRQHRTTSHVALSSMHLLHLEAQTFVLHPHSCAKHVQHLHICHLHRRPLRPAGLLCCGLQQGAAC